MSENQLSYRRRDLVAGMGAAGAALLLAPTAWAAQTGRAAPPQGTSPATKGAPPPEQGTTPSQQLGNPTPKAIMTPMEDLTSQHALASRILLAHTSYEETMLYPQIAAVAGDGEYNKLQQTLLEGNKQQLGPAGFSGMLVKVAELEKMAGITSLAQFTPKPTGEAVAQETPKPGAPPTQPPPKPGASVA